MKTIGLVGLPASGKNEIAKYLQEKGFVYFSLSDTLRDVLHYLEIVDSRKHLEDIGDILRENLGSEVLARGTKLQIDQKGEQDIVIDGIRNPAELKFLREELNAFIIGVMMPEEKLYKIIRERNRPGDPKTMDGFRKMIDRELGVGEKDSGLQIKKCIEQADKLINNDGTIEQLQKQVDNVVIEST